MGLSPAYQCQCTFDLAEDMEGSRYPLVNESVPNFLIYRVLLSLAEAYNFKAKHLMKLLSLGISVSECILSICVYQSYPPMSLSALFWTTCRHGMFDLEMKAHAGQTKVIMGQM